MSKQLKTDLDAIKRPTEQEQCAQRLNSDDVLYQIQKPQIPEQIIDLNHEPNHHCEPDVSFEAGKDDRPKHASNPEWKSFCPLKQVYNHKERIKTTDDPKKSIADVVKNPQSTNNLFSKTKVQVACQLNLASQHCCKDLPINDLEQGAVGGTIIHNNTDVNPLHNVKTNYLGIPKYCMAIKKKLVTIRRELGSFDEDDIMILMYQEGVITLPQFEKLSCEFKNHGHSAFVNHLINIIVHWCDEVYPKKFIALLRNDDFDDGKKTLADLLETDAEMIERKNSRSIYSQRKISNQIGLNVEHAMEHDHSIVNLKLEKIDYPKKVETSCYQHKTTWCSAQHEHLKVLFKCTEGSDENLRHIKEGFFQLKSDLKRKENVICVCHVQDRRQKTHCDKCPLVMSVGLQHGEENAFRLLTSKLTDFESEILDQKGIVVSIVEECIKIRVQVHDEAHFESLYNDLKSGKLLMHIEQWLERQGYGEQERPDFILFVDENELELTRVHLNKKQVNKGEALPFPVSYAYCIHRLRWFWSADKRHWYDVGQSQVHHGLYDGLVANDKDKEIFQHLQGSRGPSELSKECIPCIMDEYDCLHDGYSQAEPLNNEEQLKQQLKAVTEERDDWKQQYNILKGTLANLQCTEDFFKRAYNLALRGQEEAKQDFYTAQDHNIMALSSSESGLLDSGSSSSLSLQLST